MGRPTNFALQRLRSRTCESILYTPGNLLELGARDRLLRIAFSKPTFASVDHVVTGGKSTLVITHSCDPVQEEAPATRIN